MIKKQILLDTNVYLRLANSFHPLLHHPFGKADYTLYLIPDFQKEFGKSSRLTNKFGWVNQPEYIENRRKRIKIRHEQKMQINLTYSYLWSHNLAEGLGASRIDVRALAYGAVLGTPVVTDDGNMLELATTFGIETWGILDLLTVMLENGRIDLKEIRTLLDYLIYTKDLPYPTFEKDVRKTFKNF